MQIDEFLFHIITVTSFFAAKQSGRKFFNYRPLINISNVKITDFYKLLKIHLDLIDIPLLCSKLFVARKKKLCLQIYRTTGQLNPFHCVVYK